MTPSRACRIPIEFALVPLTLALLALAGCSKQPGMGLVVQNAVDPERPTYHDFGTLKFGEEVERTFQMVNTDSVPVTVLSLHPACTCTRVKSMSAVPEEGGAVVMGDLALPENILRIEPGGVLEMVVAVNTKSIRPNSDKLGILRVRTDSEQTPYLTFEFHLLAEKLFTLSPAELRLGDIPVSHGGSKRITILAGYVDSPAQVLGVLETTGGIEATLQPTVAGNEVRWDLTATVPQLSELGTRHETILLSTTDEAGEGDAGRLLVDVWARVVPDIVVQPDPIHFGLVSLGEGGQAQAELRALVPGSRVRILETTLTGDHAGLVKCSAEPVGYVDDEGRCDRWSLSLIAPPGLEPGQFHCVLECRVDDEGSPPIQASVQGVVR